MTWLGTEWPDAFLLTTTNGVVEPEVIFGRGSTRTFEDPGHHHPERTFTTDTLAPADPLTRERVAALMDSLPGETTVRAKGLVHLADEPDPFVLQRVGKRWTLRRSTQPWPAEPATHIVVIQLATS